jgi:hypothetical protein
MSLIHQMWSPAQLFSLYDALQLAACQVLAFLIASSIEKLQWRRLFFPDRSKGFERQPEAIIRAASGRKSRPPKSPRR